MTFEEQRSLITQGNKAFFEGKSHTDNPFCPFNESEKHNLWKQGFLDNYSRFLFWNPPVKTLH